MEDTPAVLSDPGGWCWLLKITRPRFPRTLFRGTRGGDFVSSPLKCQRNTYRPTALEIGKMYRSTLALSLVYVTLVTAPAAAAPKLKLYVANSAGNDIHVIDTATNKVIKRIEVGPQPH